MPEERQVDAHIFACGVGGALPSVVSRLADVPVVELPTSVGYGIGGQGEAVLLSMLQTCAPSLAIANIDTGISAGAIAGCIAIRIAAAQRDT